MFNYFLLVLSTMGWRGVAVVMEANWNPKTDWLQV